MLSNLCWFMKYRHLFRLRAWCWSVSCFVISFTQSTLTETLPLFKTQCLSRLVTLPLSSHINKSTVALPSLCFLCHSLADCRFSSVHAHSLWLKPWDSGRKMNSRVTTFFSEVGAELDAMVFLARVFKFDFVCGLFG